MEYKNTCYNGDIGELIVATELVKNNIDVCKSLMNNKMYDYIIVNSKGNMYKIQIKATNTFNGKKSTFNLKTTRLIKGKWIYKTYNDNDIDFLFCVNIKTNDIFLLSKNEFVNRTSISFRYDSKVSNTNFYEDFLLKNRIHLLGD